MDRHIGKLLNGSGGGDMPYDEKLERRRDTVEYGVKHVEELYVHYAESIGIHFSQKEHPLNKTKREIRALLDVVDNCETIEELDVVQKQVTQYHLELQKMQGIGSPNL